MSEKKKKTPAAPRKTNGPDKTGSENKNQAQKRRLPSDPVTGETDYDALEWFLFN